MVRGFELFGAAIFGEPQYSVTPSGVTITRDESDQGSTSQIIAEYGSSVSMLVISNSDYSFSTYAETTSSATGSMPARAIVRIRSKADGETFVLGSAYASYNVPGPDTNRIKKVLLAFHDGIIHFGFIENDPSGNSEFYLPPSAGGATREFDASEGIEIVLFVTYQYTVSGEATARLRSGTSISFY